MAGIETLRSILAWLEVRRKLVVDQHDKLNHPSLYGLPAGNNNARMAAIMRSRKTP
jgi:hypothetical protein